MSFLVLKIDVNYEVFSNYVFSMYVQFVSSIFILLTNPRLVCANDVSPEPIKSSPVSDILHISNIVEQTPASIGRSKKKLSFSGSFSPHLNFSTVKCCSHFLVFKFLVIKIDIRTK